MPRIIMKSPYIKPNSKTHIGNYVSYISTRDGVEKADSTQKFMEATEKQKQIIKKLISDYPDSKDLYEYQDYLDKPNRGNADELILRIAETHAELFGDREKYVSYIAQRPRVEKVSSHGLFTDDGVPIVLYDVQKEVAKSKSNVWTHIISLKREDAERLGYNNAKAWMNLIRSQRNKIAENMKIAPENFRWYASFHNEGHHPHIHMIAYSTKPNEAYLTEKGIENIKSNLAKVIFRQDLISIYQKQTEHRDKLRAEARDIVDDLVSKINSEIYVSASIQHAYQVPALAKEKISAVFTAGMFYRICLGICQRSRMDAAYRRRHHGSTVSDVHRNIGMLYSVWAYPDQYRLQTAV